ncbi:hypothetical protein FACS1894200_07320 [Spirochaetia bacterium]|nr:hypothetical protein FACS1894200_07320 [Spirochaetia bacterium]
MATIHFDDNEDLIDIRKDNVFKAVFTKETPESQGALSQLVSAIIGHPLTVVAVVANEPAADNVWDRQIRFDINGKSDDGRRVDIEITLSPDYFEPLRLEFYVGRLFTSQNIQGAEKDYGDLKEAYQIAFLDKRELFADKEFLHSFEYYDPKRKVSLGGKCRIITVELAKLEPIVAKAAKDMTAPEHWAVYFAFLADTSKRQKINEIIQLEGGINMASQVLIRISRDEVERARLESEYKYAVDLQSKVVHAKREGRKEGRQEERQVVAKTLKAMGDPIDKIARATGLSPNEIAGL